MKINESEIRLQDTRHRDACAQEACASARLYGVESMPEEWEVKTVKSVSDSAPCTMCLLPVTDKLSLAYYARGPWAHMQGMYITNGNTFTAFAPFTETDDGYCKHRIRNASDLAAWLLPATSRARASAPTAPDFKQLVEQARTELEQWDQQIAGLPPDPPRAPARTLARSMVLVPLIIVFMLIVVMIGAML